MIVLRRVLVIAFALLALVGGQRGDATNPGGTQITNSATATYKDHSGRTFSVTSNTLVTTIAKLAAIVVSPKEIQANPGADGVGVGQIAIRTFTITNASNISDAYRITAAAAGSLTISSIAFVTPSGNIPVTINSTVSPTIAPGASIAVQVAITTTALAVKQSVPVTITAQTTVTDVANGLQSDTGKQWIVGASGPQLTGPGGASTTIQKTVNGVQVVQGQPGQVVTFSIAGQNSGGSPATHVVVTDTLVTGLTAVLSSVQVNGAAVTGATLVGQTITIPVGTVNAGAPFTVTFQASVPPGSQLGASFPNSATVSADGIAPLTTTPVAVFVGTSNIVFDGYEGASHPIAGAMLTLLDAQGNPVPIGGVPPGSVDTRGAAPQASSSPQGNPQQSQSNGAYAFALTAAQIAPGGSKFFLTIAAAGFLNRKIEIEIAPDPRALLYDVTATARDNEPLAMAGGFTLTGTAVTLQNVFNLFGNIPLFPPQTISVSKTADRSVVQSGDRILYTLLFKNSSNTGFGATTVVDTLPPYLLYATGTGKIDGVATEPTVTGRTLTWTIAQLGPAASHTITYDAIVFPGASSGTVLENNVTVSAQIPGSALPAVGTANTSVTVIPGAMTSRRVVLGRVFIDRMHTGHFVRGDVGIAGVRVFLEDGSYATTDPHGLFSFPSVRPGEHVLRVDVSTLPKNVHPDAFARMNSNRAMQQLVHGILDDGVMDDIEFAVEPGP